MTKKEFAVIACAIKTYFPRDNVFASQEAMELWYRRLQDLDKEALSVAVDKWAETNKYPPTIADLREMSTNFYIGNIKPWEDAWMSVRKAVQRYGLPSTEEALASFDDMTLQAVKRIGWRNICMSENPDVSRANFRDVYKSYVERYKQDMQISPQMKELVYQISTKIADDRICRLEQKT